MKQKQLHESAFSAFIFIPVVKDGFFPQKATTTNTTARCLLSSFILLLLFYFAIFFGPKQMGEGCDVSWTE